MRLPSAAWALTPVPAKPPRVTTASVLNGNMTHRERRFGDGTFQSFELYWDGADCLRQLNIHGGSAI
jgi:hypothetical protein